MPGTDEEYKAYVKNLEALVRTRTEELHQATTRIEELQKLLAEKDSAKQSD